MSLPCPFCASDVVIAKAGGRCPRCNKELVLCRHYRLEGLLGRGESSVVYGARGRDGKRVAIKVVELRGADWSSREGLERGCRVLQSLSHAALPAVYDFEQDDAGRLIFVREALDGGSLQERVQRRFVHIEEVLLRELAESLLDLLHYLHSELPPVVHRDIKPSSIRFRKEDDWRPVLVDFGSVFDPAGESSGPSVVAPTGYSAPEQLEGEVTPGSDLYSLGVCLLFLATHRAPDDLPRSNGRVDVAALLPQTDPTLVEVLQRLVEPKPAKRYAAATDALRDLRGDGYDEAPSSPASEGRKPRPRGLARVLKVSLPAAFLAGAAAAGIYLVNRVNDSSRRVNACVIGELSACKRACGRREASCAHCRRNAFRSCNTLGLMYARGDGVARNDAEAVRYYRIACDGGVAGACNNLGSMFAKGRSVPKDPARALALYRQACRRKSGVGCWNEGILYEYGRGTPKDVPKGVRRYRRSCELRYPWGCAYAGDMYRDGRGVARDLTRAAQYYRRACNDRAWAGCLPLGRLQRDGRGIPRDRAGALRSFRRACDHGKDRACDALRGLSASR